MDSDLRELVETGFAALEQGDFDLIEALSTDDLQVVQPQEVPDAKSYEGRTAIRQAMADWPNEWRNFHLELIEIVPVSEDTVVSVTRQSGQGIESGIEISFEVAYVHRVRDGKLTRLEMYFSREQALERARQAR